jgi:ubiquinone/menaquinone biosynthesis C-methylase UbiE
MSDAEDTRARSNYKGVWTDLSDTYDRAKMHVGWTTDEERFRKTGVDTAGMLQRTVQIRPADVVLEIGCGVGRVGRQLAPLCAHWIGCDVSPNMIAIAKSWLEGFRNVELREITGYDLAPIADASIDVVYCTVVFMHLETWDRYNYVLEARRVLKPGGRLYVDNVDLCTDAGWAVFEAHRAFEPSKRPPHMSVCSTSQELQTYLQRAGFEHVSVMAGAGDEFVRAWGAKPSADRASG